MIDRYGIPRWKVEGLVDAKWIVLHDGVIKPTAGQPATFTFRKTFGFARQFRDPAAANAVSSLTVEMVRE